MLVEALAALTLLSFAAAIVLPALRPPTRLSVEAEATHIRSFLRDARRVARLSGRTAIVRIDVNSHLVQFEGRAIRLDKSFDISVIGARGQTDSMPELSFFPDGASSGGRIQLTRNGFSREIVVHWMTGLAEISP